MNIPVLTEMQIEHFFLADIHDVELQLVIFDEVPKFDNWGKVHEGTGVACVIITVLQMNTLVTTTHETFIFKVIDHKRSIVHDFGKRKGPEDVLIWVLFDWITVLYLSFDGLNDVSTVALSEHDSHHGSPSLASTVEEIVNEVGNSL